MPVQYDLPEYALASNVEDVNKYNKLPFYLASLEAKYFPQWQIYNQLFGKINWQPNMGKTMKGVYAEPTPVGRQDFYPADIDALPNKDVYETLEVVEDTNLKLHDFDSKQFHFLPSFQDFRENQLDFNHKDIVRQIAVSNDIFIRSVMLQKTPNVFIAGNLAAGQSQLQVGQPIVPVGTSVTAANAAKNAAYLQLIAGQVGTNLSLAVVDYLCNIFRDDIGAPYFEGTINTPKDDELIKGKYLLIGSSEAYQQFKWDPNFSQFRNVNLAIVTEGFRGSIFDEITYKVERYPLRVATDGTLPAPEVWDAGNNRTVPNPNYTSMTNAPVEVAWLVGAEACKTVKVGPPPREFASKAMTKDKFYSLRWNGEVMLTDQVLVKYGDGSIDLNSRGRFLKLMGSVIYGAIPVNARFILPIFFHRKRVAVV